MASKVLCALVITVSIKCVFTEPPVQLDEQHFRSYEPQQQQQQQEPQLHQQQQGRRQNDEGSRNGWQDSVPGTPGRDYPNLTSIPRTSFSCAGKTPGGYYADVEARCQVFHVCSTQGSKSSFLCPSGSVFNQRHFVCDWWYDFECERALELYSLNDALNDVSSNSDDDRSDVTQQEAPGAPLRSNSIDAGRGGSGDLSLASSGYASNLRDESNLIYEDYAPSDRSTSGEQLSTSASHPSGTHPGANNYSVGFHEQSAGHLNGPDSSYQQQQPQQQQQQQQQQRPNAETHDWELHRQPVSTAHSGKPRQDIVPRGFSKRPGDERFGDRDLNRNGQGPGVFVNNGLAENSGHHWSDSRNGQNNNYDLENFNDVKRLNPQEGTHNDKNFVKSDFNNENEHYKSNSAEYPLPQENNNYVDSYRQQNYFDHQNSKNGFSNNDNAASFGEGHQSNYANAQSNYIAERENYNSYQNYRAGDSKSDVRSENYGRNNYDNTNNGNYQPTGNDGDGKSVEQYSQPVLVNYVNYHKARAIEGSPRPDERPTSHQQNPSQQQATPQSQNDHYASRVSDFLEEEIERAWQREVDRVDLRKHHRYQQHQQQRFLDSYSSTPSVPAVPESPGTTAQEEPTSWRDDLSTSSSGGVSKLPLYPPGRSYFATPVASSTETSAVSTSTSRTSGAGSRRKPEFLGRRPSGGLPSGAGNGLPGASKVLAGSESVTGRPLVSSTIGGAEERPPASDEAGYRYEAGQMENKQPWSDNEALYPPASPSTETRRGANQYNWANEARAPNRNYDDRVPSRFDS